MRAVELNFSNAFISGGARLFQIRCPSRYSQYSAATRNDPITGGAGRARVENFCVGQTVRFTQSPDRLSLGIGTRISCGSHDYTDGSHWTPAQFDSSERAVDACFEQFQE